MKNSAFLIFEVQTTTLLFHCRHLRVAHSQRFIIWRQQTIVWWEQTMVCREHTIVWWEQTKCKQIAMKDQPNPHVKKCVLRP